MPTYDLDFYAWTQEQAKRLRDGEPVDAENVAEEIETLGKSTRREMESRLRVIILHLMKWQWQDGLRSKSWTATLANQRDDLQKLLEENPSLRPQIAEMIPGAHQDALRDAYRETLLPPRYFPEACQYTVEQILNPDFLPD